MLGIFSCFCRLLTSELMFSKNSFRNTIRVSKSVDPDRCFVSPDLCPNCLQRLSADDKLLLERKELKQSFIVVGVGDSVKQSGTIVALMFS